MLFITGAITSGTGVTALNNILACLNVPVINPRIFKKYEREIGPAIEKAAKHSCMQAAKEERKLVIEKVEELCKQL